MKSNARFEPVRKDASLWIVLFAAYFVLGKLGLRLAIVHPSATAVWPPSGIALASVLLFGYRVWPGIFAGAFAVNITTAGSLLTVVGISTGNTLEAVAAVWLIRRFCNSPRVFQRASDTFKFAALAAGVGTMISATLGVSSLTLTGYSPAAEFGRVWLTWWLGDATGILLIAPLVILWPAKWPDWSWPRAIEGAAAFALLCGSSAAVLAWILPENRAYLMELVCTPILLWIAFRLGRGAAVIAAMVLSSLAAWATFSGVGLFAHPDPNTTLLLLQTYVAVGATMALGVAVTVWERKDVESRLKKHEQQLAQRNEELERFAYVASHDLQEPLRTISIFTEILVTQYKDKLDHQADVFIEYIVGGVARMNAMIQGLLRYSGLLRSEKAPFAYVSLDEISGQAIKNLESAIRESSARIIREPLPVIAGQREHLISLFQNLVGNGIKYRREVCPEIRIAARENSGDWVISVCDNGVGIPDEYRDDVFAIFKRLHGTEIPGNGIGLALSRRIVEMHGGRIWIESHVGKGSTFLFTIPKISGYVA
jgi:signal transduction histidine kinase